MTYKTVLNTIQFTYDSEGRMIRKVIVPADGIAHTVYYETGDDNTVVKFSAGGRTVTSHSKTDSFGRKVFDELQLGKDFVSRQFVYHAGEVTQTHKDNVKVKSSATTQLVSQIILSGGRTLSYEYDAEERITKVTDSIDGTTEYTYDALGQLLTETVTKDGVTTVVNSMEYDNYGNITKKNGKMYTYDATWKDLLTCYDGQSILYDDQGNPTSYLGQTLTWEKGRQLKTLVKGTGDSRKTYTFTYNANGIRTSKALREGDTASDTRIHKYTLNGTEILRETVYDPNMGGDSILYELYPLRDNEGEVCGIIHRVFAYTEAGKIYQEIPYYFQKNLQGDVIAIVDSEAAIVARYSYDAWGKVLSITDKDGNPISPLSAHIANINPYRYRGYYYDEETKLYYLQSRYYDADVGRFINSDNIEIIFSKSTPFSFNMFTYCLNNAVNCEDADGMDAIWLQANDEIAGLGHTGLFFQYKKKWYYWYWGADFESGAAICGYLFSLALALLKRRSLIEVLFRVAITTVLAYAQLKQLDNSPTLDKESVTEQAKKESIVKMEFNDCFYIEGNFEKAYKYFNLLCRTRNYNLLLRNCMQTTCMGLLLGRFSRSNIKNHLRVTAAKNMIVPNFAYAYLKIFFNGGKL